jgi:hypothetical protein
MNRILMSRPSAMGLTGAPIVQSESVRVSVKTLPAKRRSPPILTVHCHVVVTKQGTPMPGKLVA